MKTRLSPFLVLVFHFFIVTNSTGQTTRTPDYKFDLFKNKSTLSKPGMSQYLLYGNVGQNKQPVDYNNFMTSLDTSKKAEFIASNKYFDLYRLPIDNMPCLVPNKYFYGNMSTMQGTFNDNKDGNLNQRIPNAFEKQELIP